MVEKISNVQPLERLALRINDAVAASGLSRSTLYKKMTDGTLPSRVIAGRRLILPEDLRRLLKIEERV
jgi:predicted DNA-binding transcriptional regulator AlpA